MLEGEMVGGMSRREIMLRGKREKELDFEATGLILGSVRSIREPIECHSLRNVHVQRQLHSGAVLNDPIQSEDDAIGPCQSCHSSLLM
jgi:hypothetical protein